MKVLSAAGKIPPNVFAYFLLTIVSLFILYQVMKRLGLVQTSYIRKHDKEQEELKNEQELKEIKAVSDLNSAPWMSPDFYKKYPASSYMSDQEAIAAANKLGNAMGSRWWHDDDEPAVYNVFRSLDNKIQVSQVAEEYANMWNKDLAGYLIERLNSEEISMILDIINQLPNS